MEFVKDTLIMTAKFTRRTIIQGLAVGTLPALLPSEAPARVKHDGRVVGIMSGARAIVETLLAEGCECVFGIPGAQGNELWDAMKSRNLPYLFVTHEFSASTMADGYARATGKPGVISVVPGPGLTNSLTGIGEALLDSIPMVCIVGDVARGEKYRPFQVHELPMEQLLKPVTKEVISVSTLDEIPTAIRKAFNKAKEGEPGPVGVLVPYNLLIESTRFHNEPLPSSSIPFDEIAFTKALDLLKNCNLKVGIYAGIGCQAFSDELTTLSEILQAPVATSVSGKGSIDECHPLAVGWGYGPQGTPTAEKAFMNVDLVLAIGVKFSEVSTAFYSLPCKRYLIQVDANADNIGKIQKATVGVHADAGFFLRKLLEHRDEIRRNPNEKIIHSIASWKADDVRFNSKSFAKCGIEPMQFILSLRKATRPDALTYVDVSLSEHWAAEAFTTRRPRQYFNPTDNQAMGWSIPASIGGQKAFPGRQVVTITGDGCFLMSAMEISTAARECLPVKFFVLDDQAYQYMQKLQKQAYLRTTATILAKLDYEAFAKAFGVHYHEIKPGDNLEASIQVALDKKGPVLTRVITDYGQRPVRWIDAVKDRYTEELSTRQKLKFLARMGSRSLDPRKEND